LLIKIHNKEKTEEYLNRFPYRAEVEVLRADSEGVPMLRELDNDPDIEPFLIASGTQQNIWFAALPINI
jgi:hypothetical protein